MNPNHIHMILRQVSNKGIEKFMHRLGTGHTKYFNGQYERSGALFQGTYRAIHIDSNEYLLHLSAYINLNNRVHQLGSLASKLVRSSWDEYFKNGKNRKVYSGICKKSIILGQFSSIKEYKEFADDSLGDILRRKGLYRELEQLLLESLGS
ncbi:MAG: transposase [Candidatus Ryanbacteria bacterium]|nr:transposase [Candidatus Ryanbacteria bacterium]